MCEDIILSTKLFSDISKVTLKNQVANYIRELILSGTLSPGEHMVPGNIASDLNVGRGVIREALMLLETEGLVKNIPYSGSYVTDCNFDELEEICSIRLILESHAVKNQFDKITSDDIVELKKLCELMQQSIQNKKNADFLKYDSLFHGYFVKKESRSVLYDAWNLSSTKMSLLYLLLMNWGYPFSNSYETHFMLVEQLETSLDGYLNLLHEHYLKDIFKKNH